MATGTTGQNQPAMTYPDVYFYMHGVNPALAGLLDMGCRMGKNVQEVLATMREVEFGDPAAKAAWVNAIEVAKGKIQQWGAGLCTWSDPRSTALAAVSSRMPALPTAAQNAIAAANIAAMQQNQQASGYSFQPGGQQPAAGTIDDGHTHPWDGGRCEVLEGGARCGPIEGGHCGKKCGGACDSCLRPAANGNKMCMWDAPAPSAASLSQACAQPLRWNCETIDADLATCEIDRIRRTQRTWSKTVSTGSGLIVVPADAAHEVPAGYTLYAFELPAMRLSHWLCLRSVQLLGTPPGGGAAVPIIPDMVYIEVEKIWLTGNGDVVHAWTYYKPEEQEYITIKDGRCACARLCDCVPARSRARILALVPTPAAGTIVSMSGKGKRECWGAMCGPCPPELICDRSRIVEAIPVVLPNSPAGMVAFIEAQEPVTGVSVEEVFEQILLAPAAYDITAPEFVAYLEAAPALFKQDVLEPIIAGYVALGWTAPGFAAAFDLAGGTLSSDVFGELAATGSISGARFATALAGAPAGVRTAALIPLMANYATYGWTGATLAQAIDLAGGTLDVDLVTAISVNNYITGTQFATAIQNFNAGNQAQILTTAMANYAVNGWDATSIATALDAAPGGIDQGVVSAIAFNNFITGVQFAAAIPLFNAGNKASVLTASIGSYVANGWTAVAIANAIVAAGGTLAADVKAALP